MGVLKGVSAKKKANRKGCPIYRQPKHIIPHKQYNFGH